MSGTRTRRSSTRNVISTSNAAANAPSVCGDAHPHSPPRSTATLSSATPIATAIAPGTSSFRGAPGSRESLMLMIASTSAPAQNGTSTQKIHRQPGPFARPPPTNGPSAVPMLAIPNASPRALVLVASENALLSAAIPTGKITAAPAPCSTRNATSASRLGAAAHATEASPNTPIPPSRTRRRPKMSPRRPPTMNREPSDSMYALTAHWMSPAPT